MKTRALLILMVLAAFLATSCDQGLFGTNFFGVFESYDAPDYQSASLADLVEASEDDRFFKEMSPDDKGDLLDNLNDTYNNASTDEDKAAAVLLMADVHIYTTGADQTLTAMNGLVGDAIENEAPSFKDSTFISSFFAEDATVQEVSAQLEALAAAADALSLYGGLLTDENREALKAQDDNPLDTATLALLGGLTKVFIDAAGSSTTLANAIVSRDFTGIEPAEPTGETATDQLASMNFDENLIKVINAGLNLDNLGF